LSRLFATGVHGSLKGLTVSSIRQDALKQSGWPGHGQVPVPSWRPLSTRYPPINIVYTVNFRRWPCRRQRRPIEHPTGAGVAGEIQSRRLHPSAVSSRSSSAVLDSALGNVDKYYERRPSPSW